MPKKKNKGMPDYIPTADELKAYLWGVGEGYIISPMGVKGKTDEWKVGISNQWKPKDIKLSPETYAGDEIWKKVYEFYTYYFNKHSQG